MQRLRQLEGFKRVVAPFAGVITRRNVDVGDLIDAQRHGRCSCWRRPIRCASTSTCRRPMRNWSSPGQQVVVTQAELRGQTFNGEVARTAASIDAGDAHDAGRDRACPTATARCCPAPTCRWRCRWRRAARWRADQRAAVPRRGHAASRVVDAQRQGAPAPVARRPQLRRERSRCSTASRAADRLVLNPPDCAGRGQSVAVAPSAAARGVAEPARTRRAQGPLVSGRARAAHVRGVVRRAGAAAPAASPGPTTRKPAVEMPAAWKVEAPWRESRPTTPRRKGPWWQRFGDAQLDALQQQALAQQPDASRSPTRAWRSRARVLAATSAAAVAAAWASARARARQQISANRPLDELRRRPNFSTVQNDLLAGDRRSTTRSTSPAACSGRSKAPARRSSSRPPTSRTRACC